jgi:hypothetical protein
MHGSDSSYIDEIEPVERKFATKPSQMTTSKKLLRGLSTNRDVRYDASISSNVNTTTIYGEHEQILAGDLSHIEMKCDVGFSRVTFISGFCGCVTSHSWIQDPGSSARSRV